MKFYIIHTYAYLHILLYNLMCIYIFKYININYNLFVNYRFTSYRSIMSFHPVSDNIN